VCVCELLCDVSSLLAYVSDSDQSVPLHVSFLFVLLSHFYINCLEVVDVSIVI
jgi:hypothetical protein